MNAFNDAPYEMISILYEHPSVRKSLIDKGGCVDALPAPPALFLVGRGGLEQLRT